MKIYLVHFFVQRSEYMGETDPALPYLRIVTADNQEDAERAIFARFEHGDPYGVSLRVLHVEVHEAISGMSAV